jgi:hypothetical protein
MKRKLKPGDLVYGACTNFNSGNTWVEELVVKEISDDQIITIHVADLRKEDEQVVRRECMDKKESVGGPEEIEYFSMPPAEMLRKHVDDNQWLCEQFIKMERDQK